MYQEPDTSRGAERRAAQNPVGILAPAPERPSFTESDHEREGLGVDWVTLLWWQAGSSGRITVIRDRQMGNSGSNVRHQLKGFRPAKDPVASSPTYGLW